jgi:hypothetical protein
MLGDAGMSNMAFKGLFELRTATDLLAKLERDLIRLQSNRLDGDAAFDFFVTAYHMLDWLYPGNARGWARAKQVAAVSNTPPSFLPARAH